MRAVATAVLLLCAACTSPAARRDTERGAAVSNELDGRERPGRPSEKGKESLEPYGRHEEVEFDEVGTGRALSHESQDTAVARAREDALSKAMLGAADVFYGFSDYSAQSGGKHQESVAKYLFTSNQGVLTELSSGTPECATADGVTTCRLRVRGKTAFRGSIDPSYLILDQRSGKTLGLDRRQYYEGEPVAMSVAVTKDSYLYIFSWDADDNLYLIFPNGYRKNNRIKAEELFQLPEEGAGMSYRAMLPAGKRSASERLLIVATRAELLTPNPPSDRSDSNKIGTMLQTAQRLALLDRKDWTLQVVPYEIIAR